MWERRGGGVLRGLEAASERLRRFKGYVAGRSPLMPCINGKGVNSSGPLHMGFSADLFMGCKHV